MNQTQSAPRGGFRKIFYSQKVAPYVFVLPFILSLIVFRTLNSEKKTAEEESLLGQKTAAETKLLNRIEIVKHIFASKQSEAEARKEQAAKAEKKRRIMELIASKEDAALGEKSADELRKMLEDLD